MRTIQSIAFVLLLLASCDSTTQYEIKKEYSRANEFLSDYKGRETFLTDTLFGEIDYACHRYRPYDKDNDGFIIRLTEKGSDYNGLVILTKTDGELYLFNKKMSDINSDSVKFDINRLGNIGEVFDLFYNYGIYEILINHGNGSMYIDLVPNENHENVHLDYSPHEVRYKKTHDTLHIDQFDISYVSISETIDSIAKGWSIRKTREEMQ